jgi:hypothetical protein
LVTFSHQHLQPIKEAIDMPDFFQTVMGRRFFEGTAPNIARQLDRVATALEESNRIEREKLERVQPGKENGDG